MRVKKMLALGVIVAACLTVGLSNAQAANCHSWSCVNRELNSLHSQLAKARRTINNLTGCLAELPVSQYPQSGQSGGYVYNNGIGSIYTTALDITGTGNAVDEWVLVDKCNLQPLPERDAAGHAFGGFRALAPAAPWLSRTNSKH